MEQRSNEWFEARRGKITASRIKEALLAGKHTQAYQKYWAECLAVRMGEAAREIQERGDLSKDVRRGIELEPEARAYYQFMQDVDVVEPGFILHPTLPHCGASPDGLVGDKGLIEIKCRRTAEHINFMIHKKIPDPYQYQMQFQMMCTGREWCDYVSFDPRMAPYNLQFDYLRVYPDPEKIEEITNAVHEFNTEIDEKIAQLKKLSRERNQW